MAPKIGLEEWEMLRQARELIAYVRRSSPPEAQFTMARSVERVYGRGTQIDGERGLIEYVLEFANGDTDRSEIRRMLTRGMALEASEAIQGEQQLAIDAESIEARRGELRDFLTELIQNPAAAADRFVEDGKALVETIPAPLGVERTRGGVRLRSHPILLTLESFEAYTRSLLLDDEKPYGRDLCQCQLESCGRFFLVKRDAEGGRPQRIYHDKRCMVAYHAGQSTVRSQRSRARRARHK